jgi:hypothetical protein
MRRRLARGDAMPVVGKEHHHVERTRGGQFAKGHAAPWGGRKPGSRGKLSEAFLADLFSEWKRSGRSALAQVAKTQPDVFLRIISSVMPKVLDLDASLTVRSELAIEISNFAEAYEQWGKVIGASPPLIDVSPEDEDAEDRIDPEDRTIDPVPEDRSS